MRAPEDDANQPNQDRHAIAGQVVRRLRDAGHQALLAGGCVRDLLLGVAPGDFDVATSASVDEVQRLFRKTVPIGIDFGVILVLERGIPFEVTTFRRDGAYLDHRHPSEVTRGTPSEDAQRRDFTINGLFLDPATGEIIDYVGGRADLQAGVIRAIGDPRARFDEDRLRLLRAVRFAARLGFAIAPETQAALVELAPGLAEIAWERIGEEVVKILREGGAQRGFDLLDRTRLLDVILPELAAQRGVEQSPEFHPEGDVWTHTLVCLEQMDVVFRQRRAVPSEALALGILLHDVAKPRCAAISADGRRTFHGHLEVGSEMAAAICRRLRRSGEISERTAWLVGQHLRHVQAPRMREATLRRFLAEPWIEELLDLVQVDGLASNGDLTAWRYCRDRLAALGEAGRRPDALVRGRDLVELGHAPGPEFRRILDAALDAQLEGEFADLGAGRAWVQAHFPPPRLPGEAVGRAEGKSR